MYIHQNSRTFIVALPTVLLQHRPAELHVCLADALLLVNVRAEDLAGRLRYLVLVAVVQLLARALHHSYARPQLCVLRAQSIIITQRAKRKIFRCKKIIPFYTYDI